MRNKGRSDSAPRERRRRINNEKKKAFYKFKELQNDLRLLRPLFFVPGWTGEEGKAWLVPYSKRPKYHLSAKEYFSKVKPKNKVYFISFSIEESKKCKSFLDFADILKRKIWNKIGREQVFDVVGHSMGGLDIVAAITQRKNYLKKVNNCITVASPLQGVDVAEYLPAITKVLPGKKMKPHHAAQCINLDPDKEPIKIINRVENRINLLQRVDRLCNIYATSDRAVMMGARLNVRGLSKKLCKTKAKAVRIERARHSGSIGITQDPRTILTIVNLILSTSK